MFRRLYRQKVAKYNDGQLVRGVIATYDVRIGWMELLPNRDRLFRQLKLVRRLVSLASSLRNIDLVVPKSIYYGVFPNSRDLLDSHDQVLTAIHGEGRDNRIASKRASKDIRSFNSFKFAREKWITTKRILTLVKELVRNHRRIEFRISLGLRLVYPVIRESLPQGELTRRYQELVRLNREILAVASPLTKFDVDIGPASEILDFYNLFQEHGSNIQSLNMTVGWKFPAPDAHSFIRPSYFADFWRCLDRNLDSLTLLLADDNPVGHPSSFPPTLRQLKIGIHTHAAFRVFDCVEVAFRTLPNLELLYFWHRAEDVEYEPGFWCPTPAVKLRELAIQTDYSLPWSFWGFLGESCPSLKILRFPTSEHSIPIEKLLPLSLDTASFINQEHLRTNRLHDTLASTLSRACCLLGSARIEMDCAEFEEMTSRKRAKLAGIAKRAWADDIWIRMGPIGDWEKGLEKDWRQSSYEVAWAGEEFEEAVSIESCEYLPNLWSERMKDYWCARISLSKIRELSQDDDHEITAWDY